MHCTITLITVIKWNFAALTYDFHLYQTTFFWIHLVQQIIRHLPDDPMLWPGKSGGGNADHDSMATLQLSSVQQAQIKEIFDLFDTDGGGSIDCMERDAAMYALGFQPLAPQARRASVAGSNLTSSPNSNPNPGTSLSDVAESFLQPETITLLEFTTLMKGEHMIRNPVEAIWAAFAELSEGDDSGLFPGAVTVEGLRRACNKYDMKLSEDELHQLINDLDADGDGSVDKAEFMRLMRQAPWF